MKDLIKIFGCSYGYISIKGVVVPMMPKHPADQGYGREIDSCICCTTNAS